MNLIFTAHLTKGGFGSRDSRPILIYRIYYYGNRRQSYNEVACFCFITPFKQSAHKTVRMFISLDIYYIYGKIYNILA